MHAVTGLEPCRQDRGRAPAPPADYVIGRQIKDAWDDVLTAQGADLVLNGHFHTYTR